MAYAGTVDDETSSEESSLDTDDESDGELEVGDLDDPDLPGGNVMQGFLAGERSEGQPVDRQVGEIWDITEEDDVEIVQGFMAGGARAGGARRQEPAPKPQRRRATLNPEWKEYVQKTWTLPLGMITGMSRREICAQAVLAIRDALGRQSAPKAHMSVAKLPEYGGYVEG